MKIKALSKKCGSLLIAVLLIPMILAGCQGKNTTAPEVGNKVSGKIKVASVQFEPKMYDLDGNLKRLASDVTIAAKNGAKLIVTTEMATTGYEYTSRDDIKSVVDTVPGKTTDLFTKIAKKYDTYIVIGMVEVDPKTDLYYNTAALVGPEGYIGKYRKVHLWETDEHWGAWGNLGVPVFNTKIGKIAMIICMDGAYMETARLAAVNGADIMAFLTNSGGQTVAALQGRAEENGMYVISSNRANTEKGYHMVGASAIWSPDGEKLAESPATPTEKDDINKTTFIYADIDTAKYDNAAKRRIHNERRPELYKDLMLFIAPWDYTKDETERNVDALALQYSVVKNDKSANMEKITQILQAKEKTYANSKKKPQLIVLPELSLTGIVDNTDEANKLAEDMSGQTVYYFRGLALKYNTYVVFGMVEKEGGKLYNTSVCIGPDGKIVGKYRKTHLTEQDKTWAAAGDKIVALDTKIGRIGMMIGYDAAFPEMSGLMAVKRADMIAIPSAFNGEFGSELKLNKKIYKSDFPAHGTNSIWHAIALNSQAYTIISNFTGKHYMGETSMYTLDPIFGLDKAVVAPAGFEGAINLHFKTVQKDWWFNQQKLIASRRTDYYTPLIMKK